MAKGKAVDIANKPTGVISEGIKTNDAASMNETKMDKSLGEASRNDLKDGYCKKGEADGLHGPSFFNGRDYA